MTAHALLVPVEGPIESHQIHNSAEALLERRGTGDYMCLFFNVVPGVEAAYLINPDAPHNPRARRILAHLTQVHVVLTGDVAFVNLPEESLAWVIEQYVSDME